MPLSHNDDAARAATVAAYAAIRKARDECIEAGYGTILVDTLNNAAREARLALQMIDGSAAPPPPAGEQRSGIDGPSEGVW